MGRYITASEAARRIGVTDKTVRKWIGQGKLDAHHATPNQLAILETDVERIIRERRLYQQSDNQADLLTRLLSLEQKVTEQEQRIVSLERQLQIITVEAKNRPVLAETSESTSMPPKRPEIASTEARNTVPAELPSGAVSAIEFAAWHNVHRTTIRRHCTSGIQGDRIETIERTKPGGRTGDKERWLTADQQHAALAFWKRHSVDYSECELPECNCHTILREG